MGSSGEDLVGKGVGWLLRRMAWVFASWDVVVVESFAVAVVGRMAPPVVARFDIVDSGVGSYFVFCEG